MRNKETNRLWKLRNKESLSEYNRNYHKTYRKKRLNHLNKYSNNYYNENKNKFRESALQKRFGIGLDEYNKMFEIQKGFCAICGKHQTEFKRSLAVDHDHNTGKIRQLLCQFCNTGLGNFHDNTDMLSKAIEYLNKWNNNTQSIDKI